MYLTFINLDAGAFGNLDHSSQAFRPGWKDIFRMNQNELESEIRKVSRDSTLDPRRKSYLIQNLLTRSVFSFIFYKPLSSISSVLIYCLAILVAG